MKANTLIATWWPAALALWLTAALVGCGDSKRDAIGRTEVVIETSEGDIVVRLYDDTPRHRDNFVRNARAGIYDGLLFNRIVPEMVIQTGDTALRVDHAGQGVKEDPAHWLEAEVVYPRHFHKQGALAAAREPDSINPGRRSSHLQWYIVTGKTYTAAQLRELQAAIYEARVASLFQHQQGLRTAELDSLRRVSRAAQQQLLNALQVEAENTVAAAPPPPFTEVQKQVYAKSGGAPHLDGDYTVFGEVVEGMPIAMRLGRTPVDARERPRKAVWVKRVTVR